MKNRTLSLVAAMLCGAPAIPAAEPEWKAGLAVTVITPKDAVMLAGLGLMWTWSLRALMADEALLGYWGSVAAFGVTANVFFTLGPAWEAYLLAFRNRSLGFWRWPVFVSGTLVAIALTWTFVWSMEILYTILYPNHRPA